VNSTLDSIFKRFERFQVWLSIAALSILLWIARYWHSDQFGLYEDDITNIPEAIVMSARELVEYNLAFLRNLYGKGHPLHFVFIRVFSWVGWRLDGLFGIYLFGFVFVSISAILFYLLVRRLWGQELAFISGLFFVLYSADTTQAFLTHSIGLYSAMALLLLAFHLYLSHTRLLAYVFITLAFITYETVFLVFLAAPLLDGWLHRRLNYWEVIKHTLILGAIFLVVVLVRVSIGDGRIQELQGTSLVMTPIRHMGIGPIVSTGSYLLRSYQVLVDLKHIEFIALLLLVPALWLLFIRANPTEYAERVEDPPKNTPEDLVIMRVLPERLQSRWTRISIVYRRLVILAVIAAIMVVLAYPLTYTTRSFTISGRGTRVHFAAAPGVALLWGVVLYCFLIISNRILIRRIALGLFALTITLTAVFGFRIQEDYVEAWQTQIRFWGEIIPLIEDAGEGDVVLVHPDVFHDIEQIGANTWNLPSVLFQMIEFPDDWDPAPTVYRLVQGWSNILVNNDGNFELFNLSVTAPGSYYRTVSPSEAIYIDHNGAGDMVRRREIEINGAPYSMKAISDNSFLEYRKGFLFEIMNLQDFK
jgi:hypothetical protein